jgi:hypothetical protein
MPNMVQRQVQQAAHVQVQVQQVQVQVHQHDGLLHQEHLLSPVNCCFCCCGFGSDRALITKGANNLVGVQRAAGGESGGAGGAGEVVIVHHQAAHTTAAKPK